MNKGLSLGKVQRREKMRWGKGSQERKAQCAWLAEKTMQINNEGF